MAQVIEKTVKNVLLRQKYITGDAEIVNGSLALLRIGIRTIDGGMHHIELPCSLAALNCILGELDDFCTSIGGQVSDEYKSIDNQELQ